MCLRYVNWKESAKPLVHPHNRQGSDCSTAVGGDQPEEVSLQTAQQPEAMKESAVTWAFMWVGYTQKGYYEFSFGCHWISLFFCSCAPHLLRAEASKL